MKPGMIFVNTARAGLVEERPFSMPYEAARSATPGSMCSTTKPLKPEHPLAAWKTSR